MSIYTIDHSEEVYGKDDWRLKASLEAGHTRLEAEKELNQWAEARRWLKEQG